MAKVATSSMRVNGLSNIYTTFVLFVPSSSSEEEKKVHVSEDEDFRPSIAMIRRVRKRTVSETDKGRLVPSFPLGKKYKTG